MMNKMRIKIKREQGEFGIGSLIIFIAMIIVSAVTATLLIQITYQLQQQAENTSNSAIQDISTGVKIISVGGYRYNNTWGTTEPYHDRIDWVTIKITPIAGSPPIKISDLILEVSDGYISQDLVFNPNASFNAAPNIDSLNTNEFGAKIIRDMSPTTWNEYIITQGDIVELFFNATKSGLNLIPQSFLNMKIIPKHGVPTLENLETPSTYISRYVELM